MTIAILGWGSLIWKPEANDHALAFDGTWRKQGPRLPVEFARIAADGRISLILVPGAEHSCTVLWTFSTHEDLESAVANLAGREGSPLEHVHGVEADGAPIGDPDPRITDTVHAWMSDTVRATIWAGLPHGPRWKSHGGAYTPENVLAYASRLTGEVRERALEYVERAPSQTRTPLREPLLRVLSRPESRGTMAGGISPGRR